MFTTSLPNRIKGYQDMKLLVQTANSYIFVTQRDGTPTDQHIVLKFILLDNYSCKNQIDNECQIQSSIGHSYIMPINTYFDHMENSDLYRVIEMPLCLKNLSNCHTERSICGIRHVLKLMCELTAAVNYLHQHQILHGAICPENIVFKKSNEEYLVPQLTGFHYSKLLSIYSNRDESETQCCNCRNRVEHFAAPELIEARSHSYPSDVWALGATFYFIVTGNLIEDPKNPVLDFNENFGLQLPESGKELIRQMTRVDPNERPSAEKVLRNRLFSEEMDQALDQTIIQNKLIEYKLLYK